MRILDPDPSGLFQSPSNSLRRLYLESSIRGQLDASDAPADVPVPPGLRFGVTSRTTAESTSKPTAEPASEVPSEPRRPWPSRDRRTDRGARGEAHGGADERAHGRVYERAHGRARERGLVRAAETMAEPRPATAERRTRRAPEDEDKRTSEKKSGER